MDIDTIDTQYQQLQSQAQSTIEEVRNLAGKLQGAAQAGNQDAREWLLDLNSVTLSIQAEQNQVALLLQALHGFIANQTPPAPQQSPAAPWAQQPPPPTPVPAMGMSGYGQPQQGGMVGSFLNSGFGRAITLGAGFGIGDDLINKIF
ncbi:MAG: hypothetical protein J0H14_22615 [Alphaproteobacteria bacterium]|nr:hypothetical protein [Alphaproteobacteria bacterium]